VASSPGASGASGRREYLGSAGGPSMVAPPGAGIKSGCTARPGPVVPPWPPRMARLGAVGTTSVPTGEGTSSIAPESPLPVSVGALGTTSVPTGEGTSWIAPESPLPVSVGTRAAPSDEGTAVRPSVGTLADPRLGAVDQAAATSSRAAPRPSTRVSISPSVITKAGEMCSAWPRRTRVAIP